MRRRYSLFGGGETSAPRRLFSKFLGRRKLSSRRGYLFFEALLFLAMISVISAVVLPRAFPVLRMAAVHYEVFCFVSDLRYLQAMSRTHHYRVTDVALVERDAAEEGRVHSWPVLRFVGEGAYQIREGKVAGARGRILRRHTLLPGLTISAPTNRTDLEFSLKGGSITPTTVMIYWNGYLSEGKKVVIDGAGRVRVASMQP